MRAPGPTLPALLATLAIGAAACTSEPPTQPGRSLPPRGVRIARALGATPDRVAGTASAEALTASLQAGFTWLQTDLSVTADGQAVCVRAGTEAWLRLPSPVARLTLPEVLGSLLLGSYRPVSLLMLLEQQRRHPGVVVWLDLPPGDRRALPVLETTLQCLDPRLRDAVGVGCPDEECLATLAEHERQHGGFAFTAWRAEGGPTDPAALVRACRRHRVGVVAVPSGLLTSVLARELHEAGVRLVALRVNQAAEASRLEAAGADGLLTDLLPPT